VHHDGAVSARRVLVIRDARARPGDVGAGNPLPQVPVQRLDDRRYGLWLIACGRACQLTHPDGREAPDHHPAVRHPGLVLDREQPRFHPGEPGRLGLDLSPDLSPAQLEHPAKFRRAHLLAEDRLPLLQREAEVLQRDDPVQLGEWLAR
jgi:hypothetical protein